MATECLRLAASGCRVSTGRAYAGLPRILVRPFRPPPAAR